MYTRRFPDYPRVKGGVISSYWDNIKTLFDSDRYKAIASRHFQAIKADTLQELRGKPNTVIHGRLRDIIRFHHTPPWHVLAKYPSLWERICNSLGERDPEEPGAGAP